MDRKCQKCTFSNYLGAKLTIKSKKVDPFGCFKIGPPKCSKIHPGPKNTPKRPQEGQNWHQCFSFSPTNYFRAKKNRFESDPSKVCSFHLESTGEKCGAEVRGEKQWWRRDCQEAKPSSWVYQSQVSYAKLDLLSRTCSNACS